MENTGGRFPLWSVLVIAATVGSATAGAAWQVGRSRMEDELAQYRRSVDLGLPETLKAMRELGNNLTITLEEKNQLKEIPGLRAQNDALQKQLKAANQALEEARKSLAGLEGDTFKLTESKTRSIVPGRLALGIDDVSYSYCSVRLGKESAQLSLGEPIEAIEGGMSYRLILLELGDDHTSCKFSLSKEAAK
jgi:hypothetical protein